MKLKPNYINLFLLLLLFFIIVPTSQSLSQPILQWNTFRLSGYYNASGLEKGIADRILNFYINKLTNYEHSIQEAPIVRIFSTMENMTEGGYLGPGKTKLHNQQINKVLTSTIHLVMPPAGIVIRKEDAAKFYRDGNDVSVRSLLNRKDHIVLCWIKGATYHPAIQSAVEEYVTLNPKHPNVYLWSNIRKEIYDMLLHKRIDYFPNHAVSFQYECLKRKDCQDELMFVPVAEAKEDVLTYTFAAKTPLGEEVISEINDLHQSEDYKDLLKKLISEFYPKNLVDYYIQRNMELVGSRMP